ncbi:hypothetical protein [Luteolibacter sp. AS25]|uniref:hypothetical protein n=1 Tax=Luteolibacter sp. AS25 TaxID=3135776 RepID=UPI00398AA28F
MKMNLRRLITAGATGGVGVVFAMSLASAGAEEEVEFVEITPEVGAEVSGSILEKSGDGYSLGGVIFPHLHVFSAYGFSSAEDGDLAVNDHDPQRDVTLQGLETGASLRAGMLQGFVTGSGITDSEGDFSFTLEEAFLKLVDLPMGFELRGGQYLNRFGFQNSVHNHGWSNIDQNLVNGRFLNEGEMITRGVEISWNVPIAAMQSSLISLSVGRAETHAHSHGEEEHEDESEFEAEGANFSDTAVTASWINQYDIDDMNRVTGVVSAAWGDNEYGRTSQVYGIGVEYLWRENGYGVGGNSIRWRNEMMYRQFGAISGHLPGEEEDDHDHEEEDHDDHDEEDHDDEDHDDEASRRDSFSEFGFYSSLTYGIDDSVDLGLRAGWVSGISDVGLDSRFRLSPSVSWYVNESRTVQTRLQYNWDQSNDFGDEHSVWFQVGFNLGGAEVR